MKVSLVVRAAGVSAVLAVGLAACGSDNNTANTGSGGGSGNGAQGCASGTLTGQGSTFQQTIEQQWASEFAGKCSGAQVTYTGVGSSAGIQQFGNGTTDFAGSDVTMKSDEQAAADKACGSKAITIPVTAGGVAIIYNVKGVSSLNLSAKTLAGIFTGQIKMWNDPAIKADNSGASLPSEAIKTFHRADGSGTTAVFSAFLNADAKSVWKLGSDKEISWPSGQGATGSDGVTQGVKQTEGGITYAEVSYAKQNNLPTAKVKGATGEFTEISGSTVSQAIGSGFSVTGTGNDLAGTLDFAKMQGYPISTVSYAIACSKYKDAAKGKLVKDYLTYAVTDGQAKANALGFAPLPSSIVERAKTSLASIS
ncbi:MAG TPA: phosphate ABC transporter substrate-binding protein PstS [Mycobacteriales bacterium]|nr:phosphate ABC transporter substrate-binding protein PstS [Mycobacteriales bacterium]